MTLDDKIDRLMREAEQHQVKRGVAAPWIARLWWRLGFDIPPPILWPSWALAVFFGVVFVAGILLLNLVPFLREPYRGVGHYVFMGTFFGVVMTWLTRRFAKPVQFTPWYGRPAGDV